MDSLICFDIPVEPFVTQRPRFRRAGNFVQTYKAASQRKQEEILDAALSAYTPQSPVTSPVRLFCCFYVSLPKSTPKRVLKTILETSKASDCHLFAVGKKDIDNFTKALMDGMTRTGFWTDDNLVVSVLAEKRIAIHEPHISVCVETIPDGQFYQAG